VVPDGIEGGEVGQNIGSVVAVMNIQIREEAGRGQEAMGGDTIGSEVWRRG